MKANILGGLVVDGPFGRDHVCAYIPDELAAAVVVASVEMVLPPPPSMLAPEADLFGDNTLDFEF